MMADALDERGVSLRVSSNRQALTVSCTCLAEDFDDVLEIVADVVRNPTFPDGEIEKRRVRGGDDPPAERGQPGGARGRRGARAAVRPAAPVRAAVEGHRARRRARVARPTWSRFTRSGFGPARCRWRSSATCGPSTRSTARREVLDGWTADPAAPATVAAPPPASGRRPADHRRCRGRPRPTSPTASPRSGGSIPAITPTG